MCFDIWVHICRLHQSAHSHGELVQPGLQEAAAGTIYLVADIWVRAGFSCQPDLMQTERVLPQGPHTASSGCVTIETGGPWSIPVLSPRLSLGAVSIIDQAHVISGTSTGFHEICVSVCLCVCVCAHRGGTPPCAIQRADNCKRTTM